MDDHLAELVRIEGGRIRATLIRLTGDMTLAEDAVQDAAVIAIEQWRVTGVPERPGAWLTTVARNKALDRLRRESGRGHREQAARLLDTPSSGEAEFADVLDDAVLRDDMLRLLFTCCHPALAPEARLALALRVVAGLTTVEIARLCLVADATMGQRISRAKKKIATARIPYRVPDDHDLPDRLPMVLATIYGVFTVGHHAPDGPLDARVDMAREGIRLGRLLVELMPDEPECHGLLALMLATHARHAARLDAFGQVVLLADQDRSRWDHVAISEAALMIDRALRRRRAGPYQIQAAIACLHGLAPRAADTDWPQIAELYAMLGRVQPTPVVYVNHAVALAECGDVAAASRLLDSIDPAAVQSWHLYWAVRADLARRLGEHHREHDALRQALRCPCNDADRALLQRRLDQASAAMRRASSAR